jgi:hypothetical protein
VSECHGLVAVTQTPTTQNFPKGFLNLLEMRGFRSLGTSLFGVLLSHKNGSVHGPDTSMVEPIGRSGYCSGFASIMMVLANSSATDFDCWNYDGDQKLANSKRRMRWTSITSWTGILRPTINVIHHRAGQHPRAGHPHPISTHSNV